MGHVATDEICDNTCEPAEGGLVGGSSTDDANFVIYELNAWRGFLLPAMLPGAVRTSAIVGETAVDVLRRMPQGAACFAFHLDLTRTARLPLDRPELLRRLAADGLEVVNGGVVDISKRMVHHWCRTAGLDSLAAGRHGDRDELLIVKTTYNYQGIKDRYLTAQQRQLMGYPEIPAELLADPPFTYFLARREDVDDEVWASPHLVVERYVSNSEHRFHRVYVGGESLVVSVVNDPSVFKKMPVGIPRTSFFFRSGQALDEQPVPGDIDRAARMAAAFARVAGMNFGALDVVSDDAGAMFIIDANATPSWGDGGHPDLLAHVADGLRRVVAEGVGAPR